MVLKHIIILIAVLTLHIIGADQYVYNQFPLDHQKVVIRTDNSTFKYLVPRSFLPYKTLEEIENPPDLLLGRFHGFLDLLKVEKSKLYATRKALANVIHYLYGGTFRRLVEKRPIKITSNFEQVLLWWRYFYLCLTTYDFRKHYGPCTDGFLVKKGNTTTSYLDWVPERDLNLLPLGHEMLLILFNLGLCQHYHNSLPFLCPSPCLGVMPKNAAANEKVRATPGNPCSTVRNTRTISCSPKRVWSVFLHQMFSDLVEPKSWDRIPSENYLQWLTEEGGYVCDCADRHRWVDTSMQCERTLEWIDKCNNNATRLGPCDEAGTYQCTTDQQTGAVYCDCNPGYYGYRCTEKLNACTMKLVTYVYQDPASGKPIRKTARGDDMCNTNMSGIALPQPTGSQDKTEDVRSICIPSLGTSGYRCKCKSPFTEDQSHPVPNCLKQSSSCDNRLCIHGTCVTSSDENSTGICICDQGYDGEMCERKIQHWSVWSECLPICGFNRTRTRRRPAEFRPPTTWEPTFEETAEIPNAMTDKEIQSYPSELLQVEICPPRTGPQCPFSPSSPYYAATLANDPGLLELQSFLSLATAVLLMAIGFSACITRVVRGSKF